MHHIKNFFYLLLIFISTAVYSQNQYPDIKIVESNSSGLILEITPKYNPQRIIKTENEEFQYIDFRNSAIADIKSFGKPDIRAMNITICYPLPDDNKYEIISADYESLNNINFPPSPKRKIGENNLGPLVYEKDPKVFNSNSFYPADLAILNKPDIARDRIIGNLIIFPLQYNPVTKELRKYSRIKIRVIFSGKNPPNISRSFQSADISIARLPKNIINHNEASSWFIKENLKRTLNNNLLNSVLASGEWYKIEIKEEGIYKLDAAFFKSAGLDISKFDPRTIKIYGNGGEDIPLNLNASRIDDLGECAIYAGGESDGVFNDGDYFLFYGKGPYGWKFDSQNRKYYHYINHFSSSNYYFLTFGGAKGKRMSGFNSANSSNPTKITSLTGRTYIETEINNLINSGQEWFGTELHSQFPNIACTTPKIEGLLPDQAVTYRVLCIARARMQASFTLEQNSQRLGLIKIYDASDFDYGTGAYAQKSDVTEFNVKTDIKDNKFNFKLTFEPLTKDDKGYLDWIEINYPRSLSATTDEIAFNTPVATGAMEYNLDGFSSSNIFVFDVTSHGNVKLLSNPAISGGNIKFQINSDMDNPSSFYVTGNNGYKGVASVKKLSGNSNLHGITDGAEVILVTHPDFISEAEKYKTYRESFKTNSLKTKVFSVNDIFNEFSGGIPDPLSIRDFVRYAYNTWTIKPKYLILFGDGNYDYRNNLKLTSGLDRQKVLVFETLESLDQINSYASDDFFVRISTSNSSGYDMQNDLAVGRITVSDLYEAKIAIEKIKSYESTSNFGSWRNTLTFVADDGFINNGDDGAIYTTQSEELAEFLAPPSFEKKKIFLVEYPTIVGVSGRTKPDVNKAIVDQFNKGSLIINYIGHGNPDQWAHEAVFTKDVSIPQLKNKDKLAFIIAATCDFGRYDHANKISGTEEMINMEEGGSIGSFCTSRSVFRDENYLITRAFYYALFDGYDTQVMNRVGEVIYSIKLSHMSDNDNKFHLIGDPTLKLAAPKYAASLDSINGKAINGSINLKALSKVVLKGKILKNNKQIWKEYSGKISVSLSDASKSYVIADGWDTFHFNKRGALLFNGECSINNGIFTSSFVIPKDISYESNFGAINLYFNNDSCDGSGYNNEVVIAGSDSVVSPDQQGPVINVYLNDRNFRNGDLVGENPKLLIDLFDESGINLSGGIGHRFQAWIDEDINSIDLSGYYKGNTDNFQSGSAEFPLADLSNGSHKVKVKSFDVFNNSSSSEVNFKVSVQSGFTVLNVLNYPNPFSKSTKFTFEQNQDLPLDVTIKIYTVSGRLIKTINEYALKGNFIQVEWDGKDDDGDEPANGIYLYKVISKTQDGRYTNETIGKLSILR